MLAKKNKITESIAQNSFRYSFGLFGRFASPSITNRISSIGFSIDCIPQDNLKQSIWHVAAPKTGGSWLNVMLNKIYLGTPKYLGEGVGTRQLNSLKVLYYATFPSNEKNLFVQQHCINTRNTENFINKSGCRVILQTRNIFDSIISLYDHSNRWSSDDFWALFGYNKKIWESIEQTRKIDFLIEFAAPWYLKFYASWFSSNLICSNKIYIITYDDLKYDTLGEMKKLSKWIGNDISDEQIIQIIDESNSSNTKKNVAITGRGELLLSEVQKEKIKNMASYYSGVNFNLIGINF